MIPRHLSLIRHGHAGTALSGCPEADDLRRLTPTGLDETRRIGWALRSLDVRPDRICVSPRTRSRQTGDILGSILDCPLCTLGALSDERLPSSALLSLLLEEASSGSPLFVGHDPMLTQLLDFLGCSLPCEWPKSGWVDLVHTGSAWTLGRYLSPRACPPPP